MNDLPSAMKNVSSVMNLPIIFPSEHQKTFLFEKSICDKNESMGSTAGLESGALTYQYDESLKKYNEISKTTNTDAKTALLQTLHSQADYLYDVGQYDKLLVISNDILSLDKLLIRRLQDMQFLLLYMKTTLMQQD